MKTDVLVVKGVQFGADVPKICVPIVERNRETILAYAEKALEQKPDLLELRIDWYESLYNVESVISLLKDVRETIGETILLFTIRTKQEGGEADITVEEYETLCARVCESGLVDFIDVEAFMEDGLLERMCKVAHDNGIYVIASNHDFEKTPEESEIVRRLTYMEKQGADIPKIAVMPTKERDVLMLLSATLGYKEQDGSKPVITMSMGKMGVVSRLCGEIFGSAVTFATAGKVSAPGQIAIEEMKSIFNVLH
ncbi:MAG: type I 3-dehydroquinate dehydratase [Lachnospiraceae bacterium]|nr:type I 3-dehydroquinate dehydratase [Lachnospiraceae bacterium]